MKMQKKELEKQSFEKEAKKVRPVIEYLEQKAEEIGEEAESLQEEAQMKGDLAEKMLRVAEGLKEEYLP